MSLRWFAPWFLIALPLLARAADPPEPHFADRPLSDWLKDLDDPTPLVRDEAIEVLARLGPAAGAALPRLEKLAAAETGIVRQRAALAMWRISGRPDTAIAIYREHLKSARGLARLDAVETLLELGVPAAELVLPFTDMLVLAEGAMYARLNTLIGRYGEAGIAALGAAVSRARGEQRMMLLSMVANQGPRARAIVPAVRELLNDPDPRIPFNALRALWNIGDDRAALKKRVLDTAAGANGPLRQEAVNFALYSAPRDKDFAPIYRDAIRNTESYLRYSAIAALHEIEPSSLKANLPILREALQPAALARGQSLQALSAIHAIGPDAKELLPDVIKLAENTASRPYATILGGAIGRMGPDALDPVVKMLQGPDAQVHTIALAALPYFGAEILPKLGPVLRTAGPAEMDQVLRSIARFGPQNKVLLPELVKLINSPHRPAVLGLIGRIGPDAREAVPDMLKAFEQTLDAPAINTLGQIGPGAAAAVPRLKTIAQKGPPAIRPAAIEALLRIDAATRPDALKALQEIVRAEAPARIPWSSLIPALKQAGTPAADIVALIRDFSAQAPARRTQLLPELGRSLLDMPELVPLLREWVKDPDWNIRREAAFALARHRDAGREALPVLHEVLKQPLPDAFRGMYPVYTLGPAAHELLPDLLRLWDQPLAPDQKYQLADAILTVDRDKGQRALKWLRDEARTTTGYAGVNLLRILVRQDAKNPDVLRWIRRAVNDPSPWISAQAVQLLGQMGEAGRPALGELRALLKDSYLPRRVNAAVALWQIEHKPDELVMVLSDALTQVDDPRLMTATPGRTAAHLAALALGEMGAAAKPALPALRTAATLGDSMLAQNATRSIALIEKAK